MYILSSALPARHYLTEPIDQMVFLKSIHPHTRQPDFIIRNVKIKLTGLWVN